MEDKIKSVSCGFYEELELLSMQHRSCVISFEASNGARSEIRDQIADLYTKEGIEYLRTGSGLELPLTAILEINGRKPAGAC